MRDKIKLAKHIVYASRAAKVAKASRLGIYASAILTFLIFAISYYGQRVGNYTVRIDRMGQGAGITIYDDSINLNYSSLLHMDQVPRADGMTGYCGTSYTRISLGSDLCIPPDEVVQSIDGGQNGESYLAHTFYVKNIGGRTVDISSIITVLAAYKGAEDAIRVRVIFNDVTTTYARAQTERGPNPGEPEPLTTPFYSTTEVLNQSFIEFKPGDVLKVTLLIWYEGEDPDHNNDILGGGVKLDLNFTVTKIYDDDF